MGLQSFVFEARNHLPTRSVRAAVGWRQGREPVVAGPVLPRKDSQRFLEARGLYHAAHACGQGPRLITAAHTWDQQASRVFAAELLAPRAGLLADIPSELNMSAEDWEALTARLSKKYLVSMQVIEHQLENAGVEPAAE